MTAISNAERDRLDDLYPIFEAIHFGTLIQALDGQISDAVEAFAAVVAPDVFVSDEITGTGNEIATAHGLGAVPDIVLVIPTTTSNGSPGFAATQGTHTSTAVKVTTGVDSKYVIVAKKHNYVAPEPEE
jgi:hypothetical protein